jgi:hypothetical protein
LRVLTFNSHQPYLHLLASLLPWNLGIVTPRAPSGAVKIWDTRTRPVLDNISIYASVEEALREPWDWVLVHNVHDLIDVRAVSLPKIFLMHGTLSGRIVQEKSDISRELYIEKFRLLLSADGCRIVYVSELKRRDWGIPGEVIKSAVDTSQYGGHRGEIRGVLQVCNNLKERGPMMGWETHQIVCRGINSFVIGKNKTIPSSRVAESWEDLKNQLRSYRIYLYAAQYPYEDGYNLALLEAMATGMPIATLQHPTSPVRNGLEGIVSDNPHELRDRILDLLDNPIEAMRLGTGARIRVEEEFQVSGFVRAWQSLASAL